MSVAAVWLNVPVIGQVLSRSNVAKTCADAQQAIDQLLQTQPLRRPGPQTAPVIAELREQATRGSVILMGLDATPNTLRAVRTDGSPMSMVVSIAEAVNAAAIRDASMFATTPPRALATWHVLATADLAHGVDTSQARGRPRAPHEPVAHDPLNTNIEPTAPAAVLASVMDVITSQVFQALPATAIAAVVHALIAAGQPFAQANALLARAAARAVLVSRGSDPDGVVPFESAMAAAGRPSYVRQLRALVATTSQQATDAWEAWVAWHCDHLARAATAATRDLTGGASARP